MIRVLVVDDSALVRKVLSEQLGRFPDVQVVGTATDPYVARDKIVALRPDVVTLDLEMPRMDGLVFLERLMAHHPLPVVVVTSVTQSRADASVRALELGAVEVVEKAGSARSVPGSGDALIRAVRAAARSRPRVRRAPAGRGDLLAGAAAGETRVLAIGASTGGVAAVGTVLAALPADCPGAVVVQHMPAEFTRAFAARLDASCAVHVREAANGDEVRRGTALVAPGGRHLLVERDGATLRARLRDGPPVHFQRPSVDVLFHAVAHACGATASAALLTGMGEDGADGLLALLRAGAFTVAQDEATSVVWGMPGAAVARGAATQVRPLAAVADALLARGGAPRRAQAKRPVPAG